jgi:hypothetical protein
MRSLGLTARFHAFSAVLRVLIAGPAAPHFLQLTDVSPIAETLMQSSLEQKGHGLSRVSFSIGIVSLLRLEVAVAENSSAMACAQVT